jgi:hypothetical protein
MIKSVSPRGKKSSGVRYKYLLPIIAVWLSSCASSPTVEPLVEEGGIVCDSYIVLDMCVRDLIGDGTVDMIYFTDTREIFMYREGMKDRVGAVMSFHQCAVVLSPGMQATTDRILNRDNLTFTQEMSITKDLISNYFTAKLEIDACNAGFDKENGLVSEPEEDFYIEEWED